MIKLTVFCFCRHELGEPREQIAVFARTLSDARRVLNEIHQDAPQFSLIASPTTYADSVLISDDLITQDKEARETVR